MLIPLNRPDFGPAEEAAVVDVLRSGMVAMGEQTAALEEAWASYCGVRHAVFMANGTVALEALLRALGIGAGDEVITVSFSFNATASAILQVGARPVFVDVREDDFTMAPELVEAAVTSRTVAVMPVHLYGLMADMDAIAGVARKHGLAVVEDAAQAIGATYRGLPAGSFGSAMFSLYATKNVSSGEGGMATTNDDGVANRLRMYRDHGQQARHRHAALGTNLRPTDIGAAIGRVQLARLPDGIARRALNAARLTAGLERFLVPRVPTGRAHAWHQYTVRFPGQRDRIKRDLRERGVNTGVYYEVPIHRQPYLRELLPSAQNVCLPVTERLADEVLSLPVRPNLAEAEIDRIIAAVNEVAAE